MKLDASVLRYLNKDDFRVLTAVETGMRNHDLVPTELIASIAGLRSGGISKILSTLLRHKLVYHENKIYSGYRLTYAGYDFLALRTLLRQNIITGIGRQIGVGKESDIYIVINEEGEEMALKLQRLGRVSFRAIKKKRDYLVHRRSASWLYMSKLGALKEYAFMKALYDEGFPTPKPIGYNRHAVIMSLAAGRTLVNIRSLPDPSIIYHEMINLVLRFADVGLIHCDLNEFNILIDTENLPLESTHPTSTTTTTASTTNTNTNTQTSTTTSSSSSSTNTSTTLPAIDSIDITDSEFNKNSGCLTVIDFPQMVSTRHPNADELFNRDIGCVVTFFKRRFGYVSMDSPPTFATLPTKRKSLDKLIEASGFSTKLSIELEHLYQLRDKQEQEDEEKNNKEENEDDTTNTNNEQEQSTNTEEINTTTTPTATTKISKSNENFILISKDLIDNEIDEHQNDHDNEDEDDDDDEENDNDDDDNDDEEEDDEEEEEIIELTLEQKIQQQQLLDMLESQRPPEGIRTRPGGRRIKPKGGEAYLRYKQANPDTNTIDNNNSIDTNEIRTKVKQSIDRSRNKAEQQLITSKAFKGKNNMKDREKIKTREIKKYAGTDVGIFE